MRKRGIEMKKLMVNGKMVTTNIGSDYHLCDGDDKPTMDMVLVGIHESDREALERCVNRGYTRVTFYEVTTAVKGLHHRVIYAK